VMSRVILIIELRTLLFSLLNFLGLSPLSYDNSGSQLFALLNSRGAEELEIINQQGNSLAPAPTCHAILSAAVVCPHSLTGSKGRRGIWETNYVRINLSLTNLTYVYHLLCNSITENQAIINYIYPNMRHSNVQIRNNGISL
jgi:hypothetical protein